MIKTRTPYYIEVPYVSATTSVTCYAFILKLYIWDGLKTAAPTSTSWEQTIENPEGLTGNRKIDISQLVNGTLEFNQQNSVTALIDGNNQLWVKASVVYQQTSALVYEPVQDIFTQLAVKGYGGGMDGENPDTPTDKVLITGRAFKVHRGGRFIVPIKIDEPIPLTPSITITNITDDGGGDYTFTYTAVGVYSTLSFGMKTATTSNFPVISTDVTSPTTINDTGSGIIAGQIFGFDVATGVTVFSNLYTI